MIQDRKEKLAHKIRRLGDRLGPLEKLSNRVSWIRAGLFALGVICAIGVGTQWGLAAGWSTFAVMMVPFLVAVLYHRHLERWIDTFTIWRQIKSDQLARINLDWEAIPAPAPIDNALTKRLAIDLDLTGARSLHHLLDTTISRQGSQQLSDWLTQSEPKPEEIQTRQRVVRELVPLSRFRDRFWLTLRLVMQERLEGDKLLRWLAVAFPSSRLKWMLPVAAVMVAANLALLALYIAGGWPPYWVVSLSVYLAFYLYSQTFLSTVMTALVQLDAELDRFGAILKYLERSSFVNSPHLSELCAPFHDPRNAPSVSMRKIKFATAGVGLRNNPALGLIVNLILPWDFLVAALADHYRAQVIQVFPVWVELCYRLDALIALANFAALNPDYAFPEIAPDTRPAFQAEGLGHPLIPSERKVSNNFKVEATGQVIVITGSNMAGKSTFLKTVGINLCLAYAGAPVNACAFRSSPFRLHTCIRITDSIVDGFSYFYAEVKCLRRLLDELELDNRPPLLYLIDEIFRGTNNRERLLGSRAYLQALLNKNGVGLLATHDLELASLADHSDRVHNYHFRDQVGNGRLVFDYKIHPGPCPTTNALKIMQMEGLPVDMEASD